MAKTFLGWHHRKISPALISEQHVNSGDGSGDEMIAISLISGDARSAPVWRYLLLRREDIATRNFTRVRAGLRRGAARARSAIDGGPLGATLLKKS
jgi:hypothetical protein